MPPVKKLKSKVIKKPKDEESSPVVSGQLQKKIQKRKSNQKAQRGVVFIRHLPHGFFEDQLRNYFEQFGAVTRLRLARSRVTGGTKGYAYVEFEYPEVAEVAAETMDNYLMFNKVLKAAYIPPEKQSYNFFKSSVRQVKNKAGKPIYVSARTAAITKRVKKFNDSSEETYQNRTLRKLKKIEELQKKYAHLGIDFSKIVVGSKQVEKKEDKENDDLPAKSGKRKTGSVDKPSKKSKNTPDLEDLLGKTLDEDSDDEDFVFNSGDDDEDSEGSLSKSADSQDLLDATMNDNSDDDNDEDDDYNNKQPESDEESNESLSQSDNDKKVKPSRKKKTQKTVSKGKTTKEERFEQLIKHKKHTGGIQKKTKTLPKKTKISKAKNAMQAAMTKQLAKPLSSLPTKAKGKVPKKQK